VRPCFLALVVAFRLCYNNGIVEEDEMSVRLINTVENEQVVDIHYDSTVREYRARYRHAPRDRQDATAYFTDDKQDAIDTARHMADNPHGWS
jgi:hypothetical protein